MSYEENNHNNNMSVSVKPEPREVEFPPLNPINRALIKPEPNEAAQLHLSNGSQVGVKEEVPKQEDVNMAFPVDHVDQPKIALYTTYDSAADIVYAPENALQEGLKMIDTIQDRIKTLVLGSKMRQDVWNRDIATLRSQSSPKTLIAVCGATGAGKSSILNAVLDDNIVPTSGMRACTAVVTEIAYHNKPTIDGDVSFLSEAEWRQELEVLLHDLVDEEGHPKRTTDLKSDAGIAWQKVHAVYPAFSVEQIVKLTVNQILLMYPNISNILGTTKKIVAKDSKMFGKEIAKYIDSKDQKRGDKKDKKPKEKSLMDKVRDAAGVSSRPKEKPAPEADAPALWPLIRQVNVRCPAKALSTGAVLVDLPGVADANAARNNIAKDYMKKANCIWILAPITRAVDDKTARDLLGDAFKMQLMNGNYDDHCITFIASKCDDISCSEVIHALRLHDDPVLEEIEGRIEEFSEQIHEQRKKKNAADKSLKGMEAELKDLRARVDDHKAHLEALENGEPFVSKFAESSSTSKPSSNSKKRKNTRKGKKGSPKRHRSMLSDEDDDDDDESSSYSESESDNEIDDDDSDAGSDASHNDDSSVCEVESGLAIEEETEEVIQAKLNSTAEVMKTLRPKIKAAKDEKREASDRISSLEKQLAKVQREKNAFCSLKRSEFSRDVLKEDFRTGLKELDDAAAEERDPDNFNPAVDLRDYRAIDLPVFTCSSRDYVRLKGQVKGDGQPTCFSVMEHTGIPALQEWCHTLTVASRERAARNFLSQLSTFAKSVQSYVQGIGDVTAVDREALREKWESRGFDDEVANGDPEWDDMDMNDPLHAVLGAFGGQNDNLYSMKQPQSKVDKQGQPVGVTPRLCMEFSGLVDKCVEDLQKKFKDGLEEKCRLGAATAADAAVNTVEEFAASMHWGTYRATLRRHGTWRRDLNLELIAPFTKNIAHSWSTVFESDLFGPFEKTTIAALNNLLKDVEDSAPLGLKDRVKMQGQACLEEARVALDKTMLLVKETLTNQQKEVSRCMAPYVEAQLRDGYDEAMDFRGTGSVARQKAFFRGYVDDKKNDMFDDGAEVLLTRLEQAATSIGEALDEALGNLAQKVEVNLAVLWEGVRDDPAQVRAREQVVDAVSEVQNQIQLWLQAAQTKKEEQNAEDEDVEMAY